MPEHTVKLPRSASPVARSGAGDISERELTRERSHLHATPTPRTRVHPKKQLFSTPLTKFSGTSCAPSPNLARLRSCLHEFQRAPAPPPSKAVPKAASMEDLTPTKRIKLDKNAAVVPCVRAPLAGSAAQAAALIGRFMLAAAWRRRRDEVRCLRRTLETQVSCSERLRVQVFALKSLLDSDNAKVRLAMRELDRLKQLLKEKDIEKTVLEKEKSALEGDICAAEDRASEMSIGWRNCRNELECARAGAAETQRALALERAAAQEARAQRDRAYTRLSELEAEVSRHESLLAAAEEALAARRRDADRRRAELRGAERRLHDEQEARSRCAAECAALGAQAAAARQESQALQQQLAEARRQLARVQDVLERTSEQLRWWPEPLTRMLGVARGWFRCRMSVPDALLWSATPARHGCC